MPNNDGYNFNGGYDNNQNPFNQNPQNDYGYDNYGPYDQNSGGYDQYGQEQYGYDQGQYGQEQYGQEQYNYQNQQYDQYGNPIPPKKKGKKLPIIIVVVLLALGAVGYVFKDKIFSDKSGNTAESASESAQSSNMTVIYGFNDEQRPIDKHGNIIKPQFDANGELLIPPIDRSVLTKLGISEEEYKNGEFNPFFDEAGRSSKEPVLDLDGKPIMKSDGTQLLKIIGRDIVLNPAGEPFLKDTGEVWYMDDPFAPSEEEIEAATGMQYSMIDKTAEKSQNTGQESVKEEPKYVTTLEESFFQSVSDDSKITETRWRDMGLNPTAESKNKFIVYNNQGILAPYDNLKYLNREVYGRLLSYDFFSNIMKREVKEIAGTYNPQKPEPVIQISIDYNKEPTIAKLKNILKELRDKNWYLDLQNKSVDRMISDITSYLGQQTYDTSRSESLFKGTNWLGVIATPGTYDYWFQNKVVENLNILNKTRSKTLNESQMAKLHYDIYKKLVNDRLYYYKQEACKEMNAFSAGSCSSAGDLSTLEIRSDFIQSVYTYAYTKSQEDFIKCMYLIHSEIRNPYNDLNLLDDNAKPVESNVEQTNQT